MASWQSQFSALNHRDILVDLSRKVIQRRMPEDVICNMYIHTYIDILTIYIYILYLQLYTYTYKTAAWRLPVFRDCGHTGYGDEFLDHTLAGHVFRPQPVASSAAGKKGWCP